jgi:hypothetical protein
VTGENTGFIVLTQNGVVRRVPYAFLIERPALASTTAVKLQQLQTGNTATGPNKVAAYCCPSAPFGQPPNYVGAPMNEDGSEHLYWTEIDAPVVNFGVSVIAETPGARIDPFVLGSKDENDVQGYSGTPTDVNGLTFDSQIDIGAAGVQFPRLQRFYVSVDSRADPFTNQPLNGTYILNAWTNDVTPPFVRLLTTRVTAGRPLLVAQVADFGSGVDPLSLVIGYRGELVGASAYDPFSGLALFELPTTAPVLKAGRTATMLEASDYQEAKNIDTVGADILPNTAFLSTKIAAVNGPAVDWILPFADQCALKNDQLVVTATSTKKVSSVTFANDGKRVGVDKSGPSGIYAVAWHTAKLKQGKYTLTATVVDAAGRSSVATQTLRVCR